MDSNFHLPSTISKNSAIVTANNGPKAEAIASICIIEPLCLMLIQHVNHCKLKLGNNLLFYIYIINIVDFDIYNVTLKDTIPKGVDFISTFIPDGKYKYDKNKIFYYIPIVKAQSFSRIILDLHPVTLGPKINEVEIISKEHCNHTINNPSRSRSIIYMDCD
ncbi:MAG: hypothetical protein PHX70_04105 [Clostridium sp.]|nr:hypothetical protein [Clostridium sp.]